MKGTAQLACLKTRNPKAVIVKGVWRQVEKKEDLQTETEASPVSVQSSTNQQVETANQATTDERLGCFQVTWESKAGKLSSC